MHFFNPVSVLQKYFEVWSAALGFQNIQNIYLLNQINTYSYNKIYFMSPFDGQAECVSK